MRISLKVLAALGAFAMCGIGIPAVARDDPAAATPAVDKKLPDMPQSPAANDVRQMFAQATSAAVQGKFEDVAKRCTESDRKHITDGMKNSAALRDRWSSFEQDWKGRYNEDFNSEHIEKALLDATVQIYQGDYGEKARVASERIPGDANAPDSSREKQKPAAVDKNSATVYFTASHNLPPTWVVLRKEEGIGNTWRLDMSDKVSGQALADSLVEHVTTIENSKANWPTDVNDAYRMIAHHVAVALATGTGQAQTSDSNVAR